MKISEILKKDFIIPNLSARDKPAVFRELSDFLKKSGSIRNQDILCKALMERENLGSTGIGENVALPHAKSDEIEHIIVLFGRSIEGIEFDSLDQKPVHFVCLLIAPAKSTGSHLKALARISRLFKGQNLRDEILKAKDTDEIYSVMMNEGAGFN